MAENKDIIQVEGKIISEEIAQIDNDNLALPEDVIVVKQLPIIAEKLKEVKGQIQKKTNSAFGLQCTADNLKEIKALRASFAKQKAALEDCRKKVKKKVMKPYIDFEGVYKDCVTDVFDVALNSLDKKISVVETALYKEVENEIVGYFDECKKTYGIDFVKFENSGIKITRSGSKKKMKDECKAFIERVVSETDMISKEEFADEILLEYRTDFKLSKAVMTVKERHAQAEKLRREREERQAEEAAYNEAVRKVEEAAANDDTLSPPSMSVDISADSGETIDSTSQGQEKIYHAAFGVYGTLSQLTELKNFLEKRGMKYEHIKQ